MASRSPAIGTTRRLKGVIDPCDAQRWRKAGAQDEDRSMNQVEANKAAVRNFLTSIPARDLATIGQCVTADVVQHFQKPSIRNDDGRHDATLVRGRDKLLNEIGTYLHQIYRPSTIEVEIERMVAEADCVAVQFILRALTTRRGEPYENYYLFMFRCEDGKIAEYWEYLDSAYASAKLFD
jgi:ketosteroid isomerase-like protein